MKKTIAILLILVLILSLTACGTGGTTDNRIKASKSSSDLEGKDFKDVKTLLQGAGFTNIEFELIDDLITGWLTKDGEVEKVSINGETEFSASSRFPNDAKIVISYHTFPTKETGKVPNKTETTKATESTKKIETSKATEITKSSETTKGTTGKGTTTISAVPLDLNAINNTNSAQSDAKFVGKYYKITGVVGEAGGPSEGLNAMVTIHPDVMAKGMGSTLPLDINIWLTTADYIKIGGESSVGKKIDLTAKLTSISRNGTSKDPAIRGFPIELEFGDSH